MKKIGAFLLCVCMLLAALQGCHAEAARSADDVLSKSEGDGFDSPEGAVKAYLEGLRDGDLNRMISAFAIESYVENYDIEAFLKVNQVYHIGFEISQPNANEFTASLNAEMQRRSVANMILNQYLFLCDLGFDRSRPVGMIMRDKAHVSEFVDQLNKDLNSPKLHTIEITGLNMPQALEDSIADEMLEYLLQIRITQKAEYLGAGQVVSRAAVFSLDGKEFLLCYDAVQYGDKWYLEQLGGELARMAISTSIGGNGGTIRLTRGAGDSGATSDTADDMSGVNSSNYASRKFEGDGFDSPEDAVKAYLEGLRDGDLNRMISAFAIESYAEKFDFEAYLNVLRYYEPHTMYQYPTANEFITSLNVKNRRGDVANAIKNYYLFLCGSYSDQFVAVQNEDAGKFVDRLNNNLNKTKFNTIRIVEFIPMEAPSGGYQEFLEAMAEAYGAEKLIDDATAVFNLDGEFFWQRGKEYKLTYSAAKYGGKWYLINATQPR